MKKSIMSLKSFMKKSRISLLLVSALLLATPVMTSCGDDDDNPVKDVETSVGNGNENNENDAMNSLEQKQYLEDTGVELMNYIKADDFDDVRELAEYIEEKYIDDYNNETVEDWYYDCLRNITEFISSSTENYTYFTDVYTYNKRIYALSGFSGHFVANGNSWVYSSADDLQFTFTDERGNECVAKVAHSGNTKRVYIGETEEWDYEYESGKSIYYYEENDNYIDIPEKVAITLTQAGKTLVGVVLTTDLNSMSGAEFDLNKDKYSATLSVNVNGYEWNINKVAYDSDKYAAFDFNIKKESTALLDMSVYVEGEVSNDEVTSAKNLSIALNILENKVQIKGKCSNLFTLVNKMKAADENYNNEGNYKSYINEINSLIDLGVYYNNGSSKQATIKLEPFYDNYGYWYSEPVISFSDGTSYSTFEDFFNRSDFRGVIDAFEKLIASF